MKFHKKKIKEVVEELKKYKNEKTSKKKIVEEHKRVIQEIQKHFKNSQSSSYEFMKQKKAEKNWSYD